MKVVVIGGDAAGATAASTVKRRHKDWEVVMFEKGTWTSYAACGFPYVLSGDIESWDALLARSADEHRRRGLDVRTSTEVTRIDTDKRVVHWHDWERDEIGEESYDKLVIATGAGEARPPIPGIELGHFLQTPEQAKALGTMMEGAKRVVVAGGGYIGLEMAEALKKRGIQTTLIDAAPHVMQTLDQDMAELVQEAMSKLGVTLMLSTPLQKIERAGEGLRVHTSQGVLDADGIVLALGSKARSQLAADAGIELGKSGAIAVNKKQETRVPGVYAAGDCAEVWHLAKRDWVNIHLGTLANKSGRIAGLNIAGEDLEFPGALGTAVSKICRYEVARTGLCVEAAKAAGIDAHSVRIESLTRAHYYPGAGPIHVKLVAEKGSGRLIGGQIVGTEGAAKRIDMVAIAIAKNMSAEELVDVDLSYAPPYSPVWDPVQMAARQLV